MSNNKTAEKMNVNAAGTPAEATGAVEAMQDTTAAATPVTAAQGGADKAKDKADPGVYTHKFARPFEWEGETYEEITFDFARLKGRDVIAIEAEMQAENEYALAPEVSRSFQSKMAARAAEVLKFGSDAMEALPVQDFNKITNAARNFLLSTGF